MNKLFIRFVLPYVQKEIEVCVDTRLSFKENIKMLSKICDDFKKDDFTIMMADRPLILDKDVKVSIYELSQLTRLYFL